MQTKYKEPFYFFTFKKIKNLNYQWEEHDQMHSETYCTSTKNTLKCASKGTVTPIFIKCRDFRETNPKLSHHGKSPLPSGYFKVTSVFIDCALNLYCKINKNIKKTN